MIKNACEETVFYEYEPALNIILNAVVDCAIATMSEKEKIVFSTDNNKLVCSWCINPGFDKKSGFIGLKELRRKLKKEKYKYFIRKSPGVFEISFVVSRLLSKNKT